MFNNLAFIVNVLIHSVMTHGGIMSCSSTTFCHSRSSAWHGHDIWQMTCNSMSRLAWGLMVCLIIFLTTQ